MDDIVKALRWCSRRQCSPKCPHYGNSIMDISECVISLMKTAAAKLEYYEYIYDKEHDK